MIPEWLHILAWAWLVLGFVCFGTVLVDVIRHPQKMWIMNVVWPVTALYGTVIALAGYVAYGRPDAKDMSGDMGRMDMKKQKLPFPMAVAKGTTHCGSGCVIGDIIAEWLAFLVPAVAIWFGWQTVFSEKIFAVWVLDYLFAFGLGIAFQYFTIKPMRHLAPREALVEAVKADTLGLTAWQIGMYGFMGFAFFYLFRTVLGVELRVPTPEFWFMMQIAMMFGYATSYFANWWLFKAGIKEPM